MTVSFNIIGKANSLTMVETLTLSHYVQASEQRRVLRRIFYECSEEALRLFTEKPSKFERQDRQKDKGCLSENSKSYKKKLWKEKIETTDFHLC